MNEKQFDDELELDLSELIQVLLNNWLMILIITLITTFLAFLFTNFMIEPQYQSSAMLYNVNNTETDASLSDLQIGTQLSQDFIVIAKSNPVLDAASQEIERKTGSELSRNQIDSMVSVTNKTNTRILVITATANDPQLAAIVANAVTSNAADQMAYIMKSDKPTTVQSVEISSDPISPNKTLNTAIGFVLGLLLSCGFVFLRFALNNKVVTPSDIENLGLTNLAVIPLHKNGNK